MNTFFKKARHFIFIKHRKKTIFFGVFLLVFYWLCLPDPLFQTPTSMVLEDRQGYLLGARIAADEQWRFPHQRSIPEKFVKAIVQFEDRRFFGHPGIDPIGLVRALKQNLQNQRIVSGGSTLSMQVIRMSRPGKPRTIFQKLIEMILATRLEIRYSKKEILALYASNAPFGGNVVGLDAAAWRYYGKKPALLSWAETTTLAVLPNSPALIHPGRNRGELLAKRNRLLIRLHEAGQIDQMTLELAMEEALPERPLALPQLAPHLLDLAILKKIKTKDNTERRLKSTINRSIQAQANHILKKNQALLAENGIYNAAAIIQEVSTGDILAYVGNVSGVGEAHDEQVNIIEAQRSTGSILKPFLYAAALQDGLIFPSSLLPDIPTQMQGYKPENFHQSFDGVVPAKRALVRSLNVPYIRLLQDYGLEKFHFILKKLGLSSISRPANYYGLPLILGGAEGRLSEITNAYRYLANTLNNFYELNGLYNPQQLKKANYHFREPERIDPYDTSILVKEAPVLSAAAIYQTFEAMREVERPDSEGNWQNFQSSKTIAWKTGTSIGFRDAWAVGITPDYAVGVWTGNADGEGRAGLIGVTAAAPILFELFDLLPDSDWFHPPFDEMQQFAICNKSGYRALDICPADTLWASVAGQQVKSCPFHKRIHLDESKQYRVNSDCELPLNMVHQPWFTLPPVEAYYYQFKDPNFAPLPPLRMDCASDMAQNHQSMQLIYPRVAARIYVPVDIDGSLSRTVFKVAHRIPETTIYWHLDHTYLGKTVNFHEMELKPTPGGHLLTLVDEKGSRLERSFEILEK